MKSFLKVIASQYASRYKDLSGFTFVFPNKRSGTIFQKELKDAFAGSIRIFPEITTVNDLVTGMAGAEIDSRIDLLFSLYNIYIESMTDLPQEKIPSFEKFSSWGEVALRDFSEADLYGVDAGQLFRNVKEFKRISSSFLTDEQVAVLREYFDMDYFPPDPTKFWRENFEDSHETEVKHKFRTLWESLGDLYYKLTERLDARGLCTTGGAYRRAVEAVEEKGRDLFYTDKLVFVGFNVLSKMEFLLFNRLKRLTTETMYGPEPFADFIWDITGPFLSAERAAARFVLRNLKSFPKPHWLDLSECESDRFPSEINVISSPSYSLQAKIAGEIASEWMDRKEIKLSENNAAIILPDETLLLPLLYSLPDKIEKVNLTMGYPLRMTATMSFIDRIKKLQARRTSVDGETAFFHEDVTLMLSHPFSMAILGATAISQIRTHISELRAYALTPAQIESLAGEANENASLLFRMLETDTEAQEVIDWLLNLLERVRICMNREETPSPDSSLDSTHIESYRDALRRLGEAIEEHGISLKYSTLLSLTDRLLAGESVGFQGEPLEGLQVMGLLETRALDFSHLIITSMNEKIMPRKVRRKSFIPESIRRGFGMPSSGYEESIFAYYFYRLMARADKVFLIYDARMGEGKGGDVSRYVLQMRHLHPEINIRRKAYTFSLKQGVNTTLLFNKSKFALSRLQEMTRKDSGVALSASTLYNYCECPLKFFYRSIVGIKEPSEPQEFMDELVIGTVFHKVMENIYRLQEKTSPDGRHFQIPLEVTRQYIEEILNDEARIHREIRRAINSQFFKKSKDNRDTPLSGEPAITAKRIFAWVKKTLKNDLAMTPFVIYGTELADTIRLEVPYPDSSGKTFPVNIRFSIDRVDEVILNGHPTRRIVDYKTGAAHLKAESPEDIFSGKYEAKNILQPLLYCHIYNIHEKGQTPGLEESPLHPELFSMVKPSRDYLISPNVKNIDPEDYKEKFRPMALKAGWSEEKTEKECENALARLSRKLSSSSGEGNVFSHVDIAPVFLDGLYSLINEIFDPEVPFTATADAKTCRNCPYLGICAANQQKASQ
ncbi:MAG: hypothetical protein HDS70_02800 [Bacteroidales bacterium]|nr:hypothetical protein [Bacteroidales bacterium]